MFQKCSIKFCTNTCVGVRMKAHDFSSVLKLMYQVKGVLPCEQCLTKTCEALGSYPGSKGQVIVTHLNLINTTSNWLYNKLKTNLDYLRPCIKKLIGKDKEFSFKLIPMVEV